MDKPFFLQLIFIPFIFLFLYILYVLIRQDIKKKRPVIELDLRNLIKKKSEIHHEIPTKSQKKHPKKLK